MTFVDLMVKTKELLIHYGWCQNTAAQRADGSRCDVASPQAACFCLGGAMTRAAIILEGNGLSDKLDRAWETVDHYVQRETDYASLTAYNDARRRRKEDVIDLIDALIAEAREAVS